MGPSHIQLTLDLSTAHYQPGDRLTGRFMVDGTQPWQARAAELSVLWYTAGKGDEDMSVHHFERIVDEPARPLDLRMPHRFATVLPTSPLSYDGEIVKVCWCVRLRIFLPQGQESVAETAFRLGSVPPATGEEQGTSSEIVD
ncbi:MAG: hypothetical protein L0228_02110 [Planctomycetes bacterium]|nr:hypothetical protein [Planctomycetota bacterium]